MEVVRLGRVEYAEAWRLQKERVDRRIAGEVPDALLLCEHEPVFTQGRRNAIEGMTHVAGVPVFSIERGGEMTWHGPGQLVGYPVIDLTPRGGDVHRYLRDLEEVLIRTLGAFGLAGERREGATGVWVGSSKVASLGVAVRRWVTYHGFALNCDPDLRFFQLIRPCGFDPDVMTSMTKLLGRPCGVAEVDLVIVREFAAVFAA
ncbi:MAG: lipoyl(octanoyl) transferase LipB [Planctomycetota bacterium]